jgi:hypothetical protein
VDRQLSHANFYKAEGQASARVNVGRTRTLKHPQLRSRHRRSRGKYLVQHQQCPGMVANNLIPSTLTLRILCCTYLLDLHDVLPPPSHLRHALPLSLPSRRKSRRRSARPGLKDHSGHQSPPQNPQATKWIYILSWRTFWDIGCRVLCREE